MVYGGIRVSGGGRVGIFMEIEVVTATMVRDVASEFAILYL